MGEAAVGSPSRHPVPAPLRLWSGGRARIRLLRPVSVLPEHLFLALLRPIQWIYQRSDGRIGSRFTGVPLLLLRTRGRRTGQTRTAALVYVTDGWRVAVVAAKAGDAKPPSWFLNLQADPRAEVQLGRVRWRVRARVAEGEERAGWWRGATALWAYDRYQRRTTRQFPIVVLEPA